MGTVVLSSMASFFYMCPSPNHVYLLNGDHTEKSGMSEAEIGLSGRTNAVYSYRLIFIRLSSLNAV